LIDQNLVNYIRQQQQAGYDFNTIKNWLINSGYNLQNVNDCINYVSGGAAGPAIAPSTPVSPSVAAKALGLTEIFKNKKFMIAISSVIGLVAIALIAITLFGGEETPIEIFVSTTLSEVEQGQDLLFTKAITNLEGTGMVSFQYQIIDSTGKQVKSSQESANTQAIPRSSRIGIPEDLSPGNYQLKATARYGNMQADANLAFSVVEKAEEIEEVVLAPEAGPDNDGDGVEDSEDEDDDNDGIPDSEDSYPFDHDNDGEPDSTDDDKDDDGILDKFDDYSFDRDNDGIQDMDDDDNDNDGIQDLDDSYPNDYDNDGVDDKDDDELGRVYEFPPEQKRAALELTCTQDVECNDFDICTIDRCIGGTCEHSPQVPCCGDGVCESAEVPSTCPEDCGPAASAQPVTFAETVPGSEEAQGLIDEIMVAAETNPESAAAQCGQIEAVVDADACFNQLARKATNSAFCENVYTERTRNTCYLYFVMNFGEYGLCEEIEERLVRNTCFSMQKMKELSES
jgi:hypothetical protein